MFTILHALLAVTLIVPAASALGADDNPFAKHGKLRVAKSGTLSRTRRRHAVLLPRRHRLDRPRAQHGSRLEVLPRRPQEEGLHGNPVQLRFALADRADRSRRPHIVLDQGRQARPERSLLQAARCPTEGDQRRRAPRRASAGLGAQEGGRRVRSHRGADHHAREVRGRVATRTPTACSILAGDARYNAAEAAKWKRIGRAVFQRPPRSARHHAPDRHELPLEGLGAREVAHRARLPERPRR